MALPDPRKYVKNPSELVQGLMVLRNDIKDWRASDIPDDAGFWWKLVHLNPALYAGFLSAVVLIAGSFGLVITDKQSGAVAGFSGAAIALIQAFWTRKKSTPNAKVVVYKPSPVDEPTVVAAGSAVSSDAVAVVNAAATNENTKTPILPVESTITNGPTS